MRRMDRSRRMHARLLVLAVGWIGLLAGLPALAAAPRQPNIVIVMPDDVGYGDFACLGNPIIKTPATDAFWKESIRFTDFHVSPTCAPTRAALLTGRHEFKSGVTHTHSERERLTLSVTTLAEALKSAGYATGIFGKWHLGDDPNRWPDKRGFDEMFIHGGGGIGQTFAGSCGDVPDNSYFDPTVLHNGKFVKTRGYCTDVFFGEAQKWIESVKGKQPFFAYVTPNAAHDPLNVPDKYFRNYQNKVPDAVAKFYGMIENVDENFGRLLAQLKTWGLEENTLVIFMTDNGTATGSRIFNAGMRGAKNTPYQGGTRVPSFWRWPAAFRGGQDCAALTAHVDVFPTLVEIAGVRMTDQLRQQLEGQSLLPLVKNPHAEWADRVLVTHLGRWPQGNAKQSKYAGCSVRDPRFTLVNDRELYDLQTDPGETKNVIADHPKVVEKLRAAYDVWWQNILPHLENEDAVGPKINPFKELYWKQFGGGPDEASRAPRELISDATRDEHGFLVHEVESAYQEGKTQIRVLLPNRADDRPKAVVYVLPVEAQRGVEFGDGLVEIQQHNLQNEHQAIFVMPTFSATPWYCDHPSEPTLRQESHFLKVVLPFIERTYPAAKEPAGRLLLGFSKSGWGAWSLLLRHPDLFGRAVAWDAPLMLDKIGPWDTLHVFGTQRNFESYRIPDLLGAKASEVCKGTRLLLLGTGNFSEHHVRAHGILVELKIPHEYRDGPSRKHHWQSGWMPEAVKMLLSEWDNRRKES